MFEIIVSEEIRAVCPQFGRSGGWRGGENFLFLGIHGMKLILLPLSFASSQLDDIKKHPVIAATREAYKRCGKDPGRYRPSAEALRRRLLRNIPLYQIDTLVDLINLALYARDIPLGALMLIKSNR